MPSIIPKNFYSSLKQSRKFHDSEVAQLLGSVDQTRVNKLASALAFYIGKNLPVTIASKTTLADYRINPYVFITSAGAMNLSDSKDLASYLINNKLYMSLETSFGKSVEEICLGEYPIGASPGAVWADAPEKVAEAQELEGLSPEEKARKRVVSVWRDVDKSCIVGNTRYLVTIKSGPRTINDDQVDAIKNAIGNHYIDWMKATRGNYPGVTNLDVVIGLTYGTDKTTNNKENQILLKLLEHGFVLEDHANKPGVLIDKATGSVRVYRRIGIDFWALIGQPNAPHGAQHTFLEILLALSKALTDPAARGDVEEAVNLKIRELVSALDAMQLPKKSLPEWVKQELSQDHLRWLASAMSAFYDEGI